jgi:hypothetical protein
LGRVVAIAGTSICSLGRRGYLCLARFRPGRRSLPGYGMLIPREVRVGNAAEKPARHRWFMADPALLALAQAIDRGDGPGPLPAG